MEQENPPRSSEHRKFDVPWIEEVSLSILKTPHISPEQSLYLDLVQYSKLLRIRRLLSYCLLVVVAMWLCSKAFSDFEGSFNIYPFRLLLVILSVILSVSMFGTYLYRLEEKEEKG